MKIKKVNIPAIHDKDLKNILSAYGLYDDLINKNLNCFNCNEVIDIENLTGFVVEDDSLNVICNNPDCLAHATSKNNDSN